ncbi:MAG: CvpA family protein, partial [Pseudoflavonifractor sp.]
MDQKKTGKKLHFPKSKLGKILFNLAAALVVGFVYFYISLPALNFQSSEFYMFIGLLCVVYIISAVITSGFHMEETKSTSTAPGADLGEKAKGYFKFIKSQCLPIGILLGLLILVGIVGSVISMPMLRSGAYRQLLDVQPGDFTADVQELSFSEIPLLDEASAQRLGTTQMGSIPDMVSQFEVSPFYTQINYQGSPVRVAPLEYADMIKWFTNRSGGLPAYVAVDMISQEVEVVRLADGQGMHYSPSEPLNRNVMRHLRFSFPTYMFYEPSFEIDEEGNPWWICPRMVKTIGLFGGNDVKGAVLMNAVTGESTYYEEVPQWVDHVYPDQLIMEQYNYYGTLVHGFINSVFGQRDVKVVTPGDSYIAMNDDVYVYSGVTSVSSDQSNLGFLLCNQRTKETKFYTAPGATEALAMVSAQGMVQDLGYTATWPLLLNISKQPTYFLALKDDNQLVKKYAMINVGQYNIVGIGDTVAGAEQDYLRLLADKGITIPEERLETNVSGTIAEIRSAVMDGNTFFFLRL